MLTNTNHIIKKGRVGMLLAAVAGLGAADVSLAEVIEVDPPIVVSATLDSDIPAFDLCWASHSKAARVVLASRIARSMTDPGRLYVIDLPGLPGEWAPVEVQPPRDMTGKVIRTRDLNDGRRTYERDLEGALLDVVALLRESRPHARIRLTCQGEDILPAVTDTGDFVVSDRAYTASTGDDNRFTKRSAGAGAGMPDRSGAVQPQGSEDHSHEERTLRAGKWIAWNDIETWRVEAAGDFPDSFLEPSDELRASWLNSAAMVVEFPTRQEEPFGSQHGPVTIRDIEVMPAEYERASHTIVGIPLSWKGTADAEPDNPRGWRRRYRDLPALGWDILDPYMAQLEEHGFREVWFWGWAGQHPDEGGYTRTVMPWFGTEGHTQAMRNSWPAFVERWCERGFTFGYWLGGTAIPNFGSILNPDHRYVTREDFSYVADTLADIRAQGFEAVGLDAFKWIMVQIDMPSWANWNNGPLGYRDKGISLDLLDHLKADPRLEGMHIATENRVPYGEYLAKTPTFQLFSSSERPRGHRPNVETITAPEFENVVNPGHEIIMMLSTDGWTMSEYNLAMSKFTSYGYRPATTIEVLFEIGLIDNYGIEDDDSGQ